MYNVDGLLVPDILKNKANVCGEILFRCSVNDKTLRLLLEDVYTTTGIYPVVLTKDGFDECAVRIELLDRVTLEKEELIKLVDLTVSQW